MIHHFMSMGVIGAIGGIVGLLGAIVKGCEKNGFF
jgi:hypothetical protein